MSVTTNAKILLEDFISLVYPRICVGCKDTLVKGEEFLCLNCRANLPRANYHKEHKNPLLERIRLNAHVEGAYTFLKFNKQGVAQRILHALKYEGHKGIGIMLGKWFGEELNFLEKEIDLIVPVPLHSSKLKKRGFNQSEEFAKGISGALGIPIRVNLIRRRKKTDSQTKKSKVERWENVLGIYDCMDPEAIKAKSILLVDDVITTGATIGALIDLMIQLEVKKLYVACIATGIGVN